jgi:hypothetical protein
VSRISDGYGKGWIIARRYPFTAQHGRVEPHPKWLLRFSQIGWKGKNVFNRSIEEEWTVGAKRGASRTHVTGFGDNPRLSHAAQENREMHIKSGVSSALAWAGT